MTHEVVFAPEAQIDLLDLYDMVAEGGGGERALAYVERIQAACLRLAVFPERGTRRDDIRPGLRVIGFERRVAIAFHVGVGRMTIVRILHGGRTWGQCFPRPSSTSAAIALPPPNTAPPIPEPSRPGSKLTDIARAA